ncbi:MAG: response regulator [Gammaproteobacteria bacterium]|nr:response regulator [Gammaproteobacteria bacterium]MBU1448172.1 response regulator [Gammaproteobacteria bacterium]MDD2928624.1 ATP-binding protein [Sideroxydans sp.]
MKKFGIERQTMAVALIPILILAVLLETSFILSRIADLDQVQKDRAALIARQLASSSEYAAFSGNRILLQQQAEVALAQQDVVAVFILDAEGKVWARATGVTDRQVIPPDWRSGQTLREDSQSLTIYQPIVATQLSLDDTEMASSPNMGSSLGGVFLVLGKHRLNNEKVQMVAMNLILTALVLLLAVLVAMRVARRITLPIMGMRTAVRDLGEGRLSTRIGEMQVIELNELGQGINVMASQLQHEREQLQQRIENATTALRSQKEQAEKANFDKTRFLAAASHDLRQPMHALGLFMGELQNRLETPEQRKIVEKVEESVTAMSGLLDSLLDISKLDAGVIVPQVQEIDISTLLRRLTEAYEPLAAAKSIKLRIHTSNSRVRSDPILLERILMNLLGNAIRYTQEQGTVLLACRKRGDRLRFEVRDNGAGIPLSEQENIFREFVQLENAARDRSKGLGLGLPIVQRSARLLNHPLYLCSTPGRGSVFAVEVPRVPDLHDLLGQESAVKSSPAAEAEGSFAGRLVLVVDDDELVRNGTAGLIEAWGCKVEMAGSLSEVAQRFEQSHFDLVICDYRLPDGTGVDLAERQYIQGKQKPAFILVSGDTSPEVLKLVADKGMHLLHKPVRPAKLRSMMAFVLKAR